MAKEHGQKVLLQIEDPGTPGTYNTLSGQKDTRMQGAGNPIDASDKTDNGWGSTLTGTRNMTITATGNVNWPDTNGIDQLRQAWEAGTPLNCKIILNNAGNSYTGSFYVTAFDIGGSEQSPTEYSITLQNDGQPTYA